MLKKKSEVDVAALKRAGVVVDEIERLTGERNKFYEEHDELAVKLRRTSRAVLLEHELVLEKAFAKKNTQWGHGPVRELKLSRPKPAKKPKGKS